MGDEQGGAELRYAVHLRPGDRDDADAARRWLRGLRGRQPGRARQPPVVQEPFRLTLQRGEAAGEAAARRRGRWSAARRSATTSTTRGSSCTSFAPSPPSST